MSRYNAHESTAMIRANAEGHIFDKMQCSPYSLDINLIEKAWGWLDCKVFKLVGIIPLNRNYLKVLKTKGYQFP